MVDLVEQEGLERIMGEGFLYMLDEPEYRVIMLDS